MRNLRGTVLAAVAVLQVWAPAQAQVSTLRPQRTATPLKDASTKLTATSARILRQGAADPVSDGIVYGALIGAGAGTAMVAIAYAQCDGTCDAPEPLPMYLAWAGFGAAIGAATGWIVDGVRRSSNDRLTIFVAPTSKRKIVKVAFTF